MRNRKKKDKILAYIALMLCVAQLAVVIISWIISATGAGTTTRSLLGAEGIRWFFGHFVDNMLTPLLVWMLILSIAIGSFIHSGLAEAIKNIFCKVRLSFRERIAFRLALVELFVFILLILLLTVIPHAILLSSTGNLIPSSFSKSFIPILAFTLCFISVSYGAMAGRLNSMSKVLRNLTVGIAGSLPLWLYYILLTQLYCSLRFSFFSSL
jgi:p-aminobenzoyl-glutamate transporter AbgT